MTKLRFFLALVVIYTLIYASNADAVDVEIGTLTSKTITCTVPLEYTDNTPIPVDDIAEVRLYRSQTDGGGYVQVDSGADCRFVVDLTAMQEGQYYYVVTAISSQYGTESDYSNQEVLSLFVKRIPKPPMGLSWE